MHAADQMGVLVLASDSAGYRFGEVLALVALAALAFRFGRRALRQQTQGARTTDAIVAAVCLVLLAGGLVRAASSRADGPWDTQQGREMHAGFVAGCQQSSQGVLDCDCVFEHMTSAPPGDTPAGFAMLGQSLDAAYRTHDLRALRPEVTGALQACQS